MKNIIACRPGCCSLPLNEAVAALKELGIRHFEVPPPKNGDYNGLAEMAKELDVNISSLGTGVKLDDAENVRQLESAVQGAARIGTRIIFLSASPGELAPEHGIPILKKLADKAASAGVILSIETHVPYGYNGDAAKNTIESVNSPGIGFNYDSANIYYYNEKGINGIEELKKALEYVTSVHLKESAKGEPKSFDFPVFGEGIVAFPEIFKILGERGFHGPYTMELEGPLMSGIPPAEQLKKVKACLEHLRRIGVVD